MPIVCPHCATSYTIDPAKLGPARTVRCARCKEVWTAQPQPELELTSAAGGESLNTLPVARPSSPLQENTDAPLIESPSIAADWPAASTSTDLVPVLNPGLLIDATPVAAAPERRSTGRRRTERRRRAPSALRLPVSAAALGALVAALLIWRGDVVRLMPQTATFYKTIGIDVNLRGLSFRDVNVGNETIDGKPVLVVEGAIVGTTKMPVDIPQLHFIVHDSRGAVVYVWSSSAEQNVIQPGERVAFRSKLAQPPAEAHSIELRFLNKRDLFAGAA